jgi:hypothetical protein
MILGIPEGNHVSTKARHSTSKRAARMIRSPNIKTPTILSNGIQTHVSFFEYPTLDGRGDFGDMGRGHFTDAVTTSQSLIHTSQPIVL